MSVLYHTNYVINDNRVNRQFALLLAHTYFITFWSAGNFHIAVILIVPIAASQIENNQQ